MMKSRISHPSCRLPRNSHRRAFTLIEGILAIVLMTIAIPPMLWSIRQAHIQRVNPEMASKARWLATEKLESIISDRHSATRGYSFLIAANYPAEASITGFPGFTRTMAFTETEADLSTAGSGYMRVVVSVSWTDVTATSRTLSVTTVLTDY